MMRVARALSCCAVVLLVAAAPVRAQAPAGGATDSSRFYVGFTTAATFGHKSSGSFGAEGGVRVLEPLHVFVEAGRMLNVGTSDLDDRATKIANAVGATVSAAYKVNYFAAGIRYSPELYWPVRPYVLFGAGVAQVRAETALAVSGTTRTPESLGVQFGSDPNGSEKKAYFTLGAGAVYPFASRFFADFSFRYGRIGADTGAIENDKGINTARAQAAVGVKF